MPIFHYFEQRTPEWFAIRCGIPTASEMDRIITPSGKASTQAAKYMNRCLAEWVLGEPLESDFDSPYMQQGRENEAGAIKAFEFQTELKTSKVGFVTTDNGLAGCSPDRLVGDIGTLEIKAPAPFTQIGYLLDSSVADEYRIQVQAQLWICEREKSWVSSYCPKLPPVMIEIPRDEELIGKIARMVTTFCELMIQKREELERRYGPFVRNEPRKSATNNFGGLGLTGEDVAYWEHRLQ